jgi:hypothetical protein
LWLTGWTFQCCQPASKAAHGLLPRPLDRSLAYPAAVFAANGACEVAEVPISLAVCPGDPIVYQPQISSRCFLNASLNYDDVCTLSLLLETNLADFPILPISTIVACETCTLYLYLLSPIPGLTVVTESRVSDLKAQCPS